MSYTITDKDELEEIFNYTDMELQTADKWAGKGVSHYRIKTIKSGPVTESEIYPVWNTRAHTKRIRRMRETRACQSKLNQRNSVKNLIRLINTNFTNNDIWGTNTYDDKNLPNSIEAAQHEMKKFFRRLDYHAKKRGYAPLKYVYVTEYEEGKTRLNNHYVTNFPDRDLAEKLWKGGARTQTRRLQADDSGYEGLARYITKDPRGAKRYITSKNLEKPKVYIADTKITKRQVYNLVTGGTTLSTMMSKIYTRHEYIDGEVRFSEIVDGTYIYAKLKRRTE